MAPGSESEFPTISSTTSHTALPMLRCWIQTLHVAPNPSLWTGPINSSQWQFLQTFHSRNLGLLRATVSMPFITKLIGQMSPRSSPNNSFVPPTGPETAKEYPNNSLLTGLLEWRVKSTPSTLPWTITQLVNSPIAYIRSARDNWPRGSSVFSNVLRWRSIWQVAMIRSKEGPNSREDQKTTTRLSPALKSSPSPMWPLLRTSQTTS